MSAALGSGSVVLLFFPAAFTSVCTDELCGVSAAIKEYEALDAVVYGISPDSPFAQEAFAKAEKITIPLLSDYQREVTKAYDVVLDDFAGLGAGTKRAAFVIDREGVIRYAEQTPTPGDLPSFEKVKAALAALK